MIQRIALTLMAAAWLTACSGDSSPAPKGWRALPGPNSWALGSGTEAQEYRYAAGAFGGTLHDLASEVTIDVLTSNRGAKFLSSSPFQACPGAAAVATFRLPKEKELLAAFAIRRGEAVRIRYTRPRPEAADLNALDAMRRVLCVLPAS